MKRRRSSTGAFQPSKRPRLTRTPRGRLFDNVEKKNIDATSTTVITAAQTTANLVLLNAIDDGTLATQRIGRRTVMTSIEYRFEASLAATTAGNSPIRLLIVYDRQPNGALAASTDIVTVDNIGSMMNLNNSKRFKVLVDEIIEELGTAGPGGFYRKGFRDFTAKGRKTGLPCEFKGSAGDITDITTGALIAAIWQNGNLITASPTNLLWVRTRFTDK